MKNKEDQAKKRREYYERNAEEIKRKRKEYYLKNRKKCMESIENSKKKNPAKYKAMRKKWNLEYKERYNELARIRRKKNTTERGRKSIETRSRIKRIKEATGTGDSNRRISILCNKYGEENVLEYYTALKSQKGKCFICGSPPSGNGASGQHLHLDHDHNTGEFRGALCYSCNVAIGFLGDNSFRATMAALYLEGGFDARFD